MEMCLSCFAFIEGFIECINTYALVYIAYSGTDFLTASQNCSALFQRNLMSALLMGK